MTPNKEYLTASEISKEHKVSARYIRKLINEMLEEDKTNLIHKDNTNRWMVHRLLLPKFKSKRSKAKKYYALSIDPTANYDEEEIDKIMNFVVSNMADSPLEIHYTIERKKANGRNHIHCYIYCAQKKKLIENIRLGFSSVSYQQQEIFDLIGWKNYITKDGSTIKTLKN